MEKTFTRTDIPAAPGLIVEGIDKRRMRSPTCTARSLVGSVLTAAAKTLVVPVHLSYVPHRLVRAVR